MRRRDLLRSGGALGALGLGLPVGTATVGVTADEYAFYDDFEDGTLGADPGWTVYDPEGDFSASIVDRSSPDGGSKVLNVSETTGGGTNGIVGWQNAYRGWDGEWTLQGLFYTENVPLGTPFQGHRAGFYYDPDTDDRPLIATLGFRDGNGNIKPFKIDGNLVDTVERSYDPDWQVDTWYWYEVSHDGSGTYTGRLWEDGTVRPSEPNARSVGSAPGTEARVGTIEMNGARNRAFDMQHAFVGWTGSVSRTPGFTGRYYNHSADHPDFIIEDEFDGVNPGLVKPSLPLRLTDAGDAYYEQFDWYDDQYLTATRVDESLEFGANFFPPIIDEGKPGDPSGFAVHWTATAEAPQAGSYEFTATSDDDAWVFVDGELVIDLGGHHRSRTRSTTVELSAGEHSVDVYFAERLGGSALSFTPDTRLDVFTTEPDAAPAPGGDFAAARDQKLALADRIDENGLGYLADREQVEPALEGLVDAVSGGELPEEEGTEVVERMILGEQVTDAVLAGAGPGSSEHLSIDTNISKLTAQNAVNPIIELLFAGISVVRAARHIPFVGGAAKRAANFIADLVADVAGKFSRSLERLIRQQGEDAGFAILSEVESRAKDRGKPIAEDEYVEARDAAGAPFIEDSSWVIFRDFLFGEEYDLQGESTEPLDESLANLVESLDAKPDGPEYGGDDIDARYANERALDDVNGIYEDVDEALTDSLISSILKHIGVISGILALVAFIAGVTGVGAAAGAIAGVAAGLLGIGVGVPLSMAQWGTGSNGILAARYRHQSALPEVVNPS